MFLSHVAHNKPFHSFEIYILTTGGSHHQGHFPKSQKIPIFVMLPIPINLKRCLSTIYGLQAQDNDHKEEFSDS